MFSWDEKMKILNRNKALNLYMLVILVATIIAGVFFGPTIKYQFNTKVDPSFVRTFLYIIFHNMIVLIALASSLIFGRWTIIASMGANMLQIGWIIGTAANICSTLLLMLPHGIPEIFAYVFFANICWLGSDWFKSHKSTFFKLSILTLLILIIAGLIESASLTLIN